MSSQAQGGPSGVDKEKKSLGKVLSRMRTVFKGHKGKGVASPSTGGVAAVAGPSTTAATETAPVPTTTTAVKKLPGADYPGATKIPRSQIHEERARKLGARFGLEIQPNEWHSTEGHALRVEKPIRMRIHRTCHECNTTFGPSITTTGATSATDAKGKGQTKTVQECSKCKHTRCGKCTRYPPRRTEAEKLAGRERKAAIVKKMKEDAPIVPDYEYCLAGTDGRPVKKIVLTRPSKKAGGQDLVLKKPRQRVRRSCHECCELFRAGNKTCVKCGHGRCTDCPRDPPKKDKYPLGYPGDEFGPSAIPQFDCHECDSLFPPDSADGTECKSCKHPKCSKCIRAKPRKIEPEPDPEVLRIIQAKIESMGLS